MTRSLAVETTPPAAEAYEGFWPVSSRGFSVPALAAAWTSGRIRLVYQGKGGAAVQVAVRVGLGERYGFGLENINGWIGHDRNMPGYGSLTTYLPSKQAAIVLLLDSNINPLDPPCTSTTTATSGPWPHDLTHPLSRRRMHSRTDMAQPFSRGQRFSLACPPGTAVADP